MSRILTACIVLAFALSAATPLRAQFTMIQDLDPGSNAMNAMYLIPRNVLPGTTPKLLFSAKTNTGTFQVHVYDGSTTTPLVNPYSVMMHAATAGPVLYYQGMTGFYTGGQPWVTDGSPGGAYQLMTVQSTCGYLSDVGARTINGTTYLSFAAVKCRGGGVSGMDAYLYKTDGTARGSVKLKSWSGTIGAGTTHYHALGSWCLFYGGGNTRALYRSNGTSKGTTTLKTFAAMYAPVVAGGYSIFPANDGVNGLELWRSNATATGTTMVANLAAGSASSTPDFLTVLGSYVYFSANDGTGGKLYRYDPAANTITVIPMDASDPKWLTVMDGKLYFSAVTATDGRELWVYDPAANAPAPNPHLVANIAAGSASGDPHYGEAMPQGMPNMRDHDPFFAVLNGYLYFAAKGDADYTLWRSNGSTVQEVTGAGVILPNCFTVMGSILYFIGFDATNGFRLYAFDPSQYPPPSPKSMASAAPTEITLGQNYPNPFNPATVIGFTLPEPSVVTLTVFDVLGREVTRLVDGMQYGSGEHHIRFDASTQPSGLYYYQLEVGRTMLTQRMLLLR